MELGSWGARWGSPLKPMEIDGKPMENPWKSMDITEK